VRQQIWEPVRDAAPHEGKPGLRHEMGRQVVHPLEAQQTLLSRL